MVIFLYFLGKSFTFEGTGIDINNASFIMVGIGLIILAIWVVYILASLLPQKNQLTLLRKINIVLPICLIFGSVWLLPNFIDINNEVLWQRWANSMGFLAIISMITEVLIFFIKKQN